MLIFKRGEKARKTYYFLKYSESKLYNQQPSKNL